MKCSLCRNESDCVYEVERGKPRPLCGTCLGRWAPKELDALLGVKPPYDYAPMPMQPPSRPVAAGIALSREGSSSILAPVHDQEGAGASPGQPPP